MDEHRESFNKETDDTRKWQLEVKGIKTIITVLENTLEGFNIRLDEVEEWISGLKDKAVTLNQTEQQKEKKLR